MPDKKRPMDEGNLPGSRLEAERQPRAASEEEREATQEESDNGDKMLAQQHGLKTVSKPLAIFTRLPSFSGLSRFHRTALKPAHAATTSTLSLTTEVGMVIAAENQLAQDRKEREDQIAHPSSTGRRYVLERWNMPDALPFMLDPSG